MPASNYQTGHEAEKRAAVYLTNHGYKILRLNWKTRMCEIDIIAVKDTRLYFVEVKSRKTTTWGTGLDYITAKKLKQMRFAAASWVHLNGWRGDYQLAGLGVEGSRFELVLIED